MFTMLLSCAREPDFTRLKIEAIYPTLGDPVDFDITDQTIFVAENTMGFSIHDRVSGEKLHQFHQIIDEEIGLLININRILLTRFYKPMNTLFVYDRTAADRFLVYGYDEDIAEINFRSSFTGRTNNIRDMIIETIPFDTDRVKLTWSYWGDPSNAIRISYFNVETVSALQISMENVPNMIYALDLKNNLLLSAQGDRGIMIHDGALNRINEINLSGSARDVKVLGDAVYVAANNGGLHLLKFNDISTPGVTSRNVNISGNARTLAVNDNYLAVGTTDGLMLFDIQNPLEPKLLDMISRNTIGDINKVMFFRDRLYAASQTLGIVRLKIN
jgi:hypothetical protein